MKYARIAFWCVIGIGVATFFGALGLWQNGVISDETGRVVFGIAVIPSFVFFMTISGYSLFLGFSQNEVILMRQYSAASISRIKQPVRYWIATFYHVLVIMLSVCAIIIVIKEIMK